MPQAARSPWPMAASTGEALTLPDEQAEPALTRTPARSRAMTWVSEAKPGVATQRVLGRRGAASPMTTAPAAFRRAAAAARQARFSSTWMG